MRPGRQGADGLRERFERLAAAMDQAEDDVLADMAFHPDHGPKIGATNPLERLIGEIKRRTDVVGRAASPELRSRSCSLPNDAAGVRLAGALLLEQDDEWAVGRRYMRLETLGPFGHGDHLRLPAVAA